MAHHIQDSPKKKKKKPTAFLGCFGFSGRRDDNLFSGNKPKSPASASASAANKRRRWPSLSLCRKQKSAAKTVPIADTTAAAVAVMAADDEVNRSKEIRVVKSDSSKKTSSKNRQLLAAPAAGGRSPPPVPGETIDHKKTTKASRYDKTESIIEKTKTSDHSNSAENLNLTIHKKASKKNISAAEGATDVLRRTSSAGNSQIKKKKPATTAAAHGGSIESTRNQDFTYGMSMLMVILIIMLFWGRLCAIVCTAAWFYLVRARMRGDEEPESGRQNDGRRVSNGGGLHFSSAERKKKVVLDGFLERNHRTTSSIIL